MATLKDALDIISKLSYDDLESLKTIVLGGATLFFRRVITSEEKE